MASDVCGAGEGGGTLLAFILLRFRVSFVFFYRRLRRSYRRLRRIISFRHNNHMIVSETPIFVAQSGLQEILRRRATNIACCVCGTPVPLLLPRRSEITTAMNQGQGFYAVCAFGPPNLVDGRDVLASIGWAAL